MGSVYQCDFVMNCEGSFYFYLKGAVVCRSFDQSRAYTIIVTGNFGSHLTISVKTDPGSEIT